MLGQQKKLVLWITAMLAIDGFLIWYPPGLRCLDARFVYTPDEAHRFLLLLGDTGRWQYFRHQLVDLMFLSTYSTFLFVYFGTTPARRVFCLLPGFFDIVETVGILVLLAKYPAPVKWLCLVVAAATPLKWAALAAVALVTGLPPLAGLLCGIK